VSGTDTSFRLARHGGGMTAEAVLFDLDDTLYPYPPCNEAGKAGAFAAARDRGYDLDREDFDALYRAGRREAKRDTDGTAASHGRVLYFRHGLREHAGGPAPDDALALSDAYWSSYLDAMEPAPGLERVLDDLAERGVAVGVVTNLTTRIQLRKLRRLGIGDRLDALVTSEEAGREKPGSAPFTLALSRLDRSPSAAVMVGDNPVTDVAGANPLGIETVLVGDAPPDGAPATHRPDHRVDALADVPEVAP
jgi:putative hydrolase of the HAD superfamily